MLDADWSLLIVQLRLAAAVRRIQDGSVHDREFGEQLDCGATDLFRVR